MEHTDETSPDQDPAKSVSDLMSPGTTLMVGTGDPSGRWSFRPLTVARVGGGGIDILLDTDEQWVRDFTAGDPVHVTLSDDRENAWADMSGTGAISRDDALIDELWNPAAGAFFDEGRETPGIGVLTVDVADGRYWSAPSGRLGSLISMVKAKLGNPESSGEHGAVDANR